MSGPMIFLLFITCSIFMMMGADKIINSIVDRDGNEQDVSNVLKSPTFINKKVISELGCIIDPTIL